MPAVFDSLVQHRGLTPHKAWRVAYIVPFIIIVAVALGMLLTCTDTPTGKWSERKLAIVEGNLTTPPPEETKDGQVLPQDTEVSELNSKKANYNETNKTPQSSDLEIQLDGHAGLDAIHGEVIVAPTLKEVLYVVCSLPTLTLVGQYACSFGAELALDGILGSYYLVNFPHLGQTKCGQWAAMFGLLNVLFRPLGGYISDLLYRHTSSLWVKKLWLVFLGVVTGAFLLAAGLSNPKSEATMFGLFAGLAFFLEAANGANFSLVPHVYPAANGRLLSKFLAARLLTWPLIQGSYQEPLALQETWGVSSLILFSGITGYITIAPFGPSGLYLSRSIWRWLGFGQFRSSLDSGAEVLERQRRESMGIPCRKYVACESS